MQLVEQHVIKPNSPYWQAIDDAAFAAKNLYNLANYTVRQELFANENLYDYYDLQRLLKDTNAYKALPSKVSQQVLIGLGKNWKAWWRARQEWVKDPSKFLGRPALPHYKDKIDGRHSLRSLGSTGAPSKRQRQTGPGRYPGNAGGRKNRAF